MAKKPIAIFRTKGEILTARDMGNVRIADEVIKDATFNSAKMNDLLGFTAVSGSDYTIVSVKAVKDDPQAFMSMAFGEKE